MQKEIKFSTKVKIRFTNKGKINRYMHECAGL